MTPADFDFVCRLVRERSGIVLETGKEYLVDARLTPVARQCELGTVAELIARLRGGADSGLIIRVIEAMVTTETSFFRDIHPFETLRTTVLPDMIRRRRAARQLAVWFAASSTGQEPYSFAMLLREHFPELTTWRLDLIATDLSTDVLGRARAGKYSQLEVNRGLPATMLVKYFRQHGATWELNDDVRRMIDFRELNLTRPWPALPQFDLIFLRNVMIYFDVETKKQILTRVARLLRRDGFLLLGGAETTLNLYDALRRMEQLKGGFYQQVG
ncbi:MAG TPA: protein-glutamate O-methyltransferase CheR [Gemmataceae bacterium]|jgi:chemotaxis protein methyltransferase CheR|nr:protein-glutamate O-methyltransferase CheR [Gemmataceae bacterium]